MPSPVQRALRERSAGARRPRTRWIAALVAGLWLLGTLPATAETEYDPQRAGHPLRIIAYVVHPVGVALDWLIMRPAWWIGSHEPFRTLFGQTDDDGEYHDPIAPVQASADAS